MTLVVFHGDPRLLMRGSACSRLRLRSAREVALIVRASSLEAPGRSASWADTETWSRTEFLSSPTRVLAQNLAFRIGNPLLKATYCALWRIQESLTYHSPLNYSNFFACVRLHELPAQGQGACINKTHMQIASY